MRVTDEYLLMKARRDDGIGDIARELIAARKVVEAARDHGRWCSIKLSCRLCAALREYDAIMRDAPVEVPHGECPYPVHKDRSIKACVEAGDCGCGARDDGTTREG